MGALTLKSFPFELRGWDIEKFESIDPTDGFGSNTRVYISKDQIVQIEPDYNTHTFNTWLTDKGRQFFDGIFGTWGPNKINKSSALKKDSWFQVLDIIIKNMYIFDHCNKQSSQNYFFTLVFENLSIENLNMLLIISQNYSFIKLRRAESFKLNNDLESNYQLNIASDKIKLNSSTLCLLISNNPRYEGYYLNLNLRQRFLKGDFKCLTIGSLIDLTFPTSFLGSNLKNIKTIVEGNSLICQDLKFARNPILIYNTELFKRYDGENTFNMFKTLFYLNIFNKTWNGLNMLNSSLSETGIHTILKFPLFSLKDLVNFSSLYFLNVTTNNISNFKKITELKLLNYFSSSNKQIQNNQLILDQNSKNSSNFSFTNKASFLNSNSGQIKYLHLPSSTFYENEETFINTEGLIKRTTKLLSKKQTKNNWQILRKFLKHFKKNLIFLNQKDNKVISFIPKRVSNFKNFINFQYYAVQSLTNLNFYLNIKNNPLILHNHHKNFKLKTEKMNGTKLKYWIDDFFSGGKDDYSQNSLILTNCSKILRSESTNFF